MSIEYPGAIPLNVNRDASYSVVHGASADRMEIRLVYTLHAGERELLTTDHHDELVDMVKAVKIEHNGVPGGRFYVNEYMDVLVPTSDGCFYAGNYGKYLEFDFEGTILGPSAPDHLRPGDEWQGPHVGIRYVITADGSDIKYTRKLTPTREKTERLSEHVGAKTATKLARRLGGNKGPTGGRIYINEASEFFAPLDDTFVYLGHLDEDSWFPVPEIPRDD